MAIKTTTHLNFRGQARQALQFYQSVFGGEIMVLSYADAHAVQNPKEADQIMWGQVASQNGFHIMAYDVPAQLDWNAGIIPLFVSVRATDAYELQLYWDKLATGGAVIQPIGPAAWSPLYGMVKDRFGITWVIDLEVPYTA